MMNEEEVVSMRKAVSLTAGISFIVLIVTSVVLYIVPHGRVAYWANWQLWGLSKTQWGDMHTTIGVLFCLAGFVHVWYNWNAMVTYMKRSRRLVVVTKEFNIAVALTGVTIVGTYFAVPPFSWVLDLNSYIKTQGSKEYGTPPYGHAELSSLKTLCSRMGHDLSESLNRLKAAGVAFADGESIVLQVSKENNMTPQEVYNVMQGKPKAFKGAVGVQSGCGGTPEGGHGMGFGKMTVKEVCSKFSVSVSDAGARLAAEGIKYSEGDTLRAIADNNDLSPYNVYEVITGKR